jgi:hypothetical protein
MNAAGLSFHHLGLAAREEAPATAFLADLGYAIGERVHDSLQRVHLRLCTHPAMPDVELVLPAGGEGKSPIESILAKQETLMYHQCYTTEDVAASLAALEASGHRVMMVAPPQPAVLFGGKQVSFYQVLGFGLIELIDLSS